MLLIKCSQMKKRSQEVVKFSEIKSSSIKIIFLFTANNAVKLTCSMVRHLQICLHSRLRWHLNSLQSKLLMAYL